MLKEKLKKILNIFQWLVTIVLVSVVLLLIFTAFDPVKNFRVLRVMSGSMEPAIKIGSLVFTQKVKPETLKKGEIITYTSMEDPNISVTHRLVAIEKREGKTVYKTKGDANNADDVAEISSSQIKGKVIFSLPFLGYLSVWIKKPLGFGLLVILPAILIIISEIFNIKKTIEKEVEKRSKPVSLLLILCLLGTSLFQIKPTSAYLSDTAVISGTTFSAGCWALPSVPNLIYPTDGTVADSTWLQNPVMDWQDSTSTCSTGFITYIYESYHDSGLTSLAYQSSPLSSSIIPAPGTPDGTYYWRVKAFDGTTYSDWSEVWLLTVNRTPPAPSLVSPANNSVLKVHDFIFDWSDVTDLTTVTYDWEGSTINDFSSGGMWNHYGLTASNVYSPGTPDNVYYWHVRACDAASNCSPWTEVWKVTVDSTAPTSVITLPVNNGSNSVVDSASWDGKVAGTAVDNLSGVNHVDLSVYRAIDNTYWNGSSWVAGSETTVRVSATGSTSWAYTVGDPSVSTTYTITSHSVDNAGNIENSYILTIVVPIPNPTITPTLSPTPEISPGPSPTDEPSPTSEPSTTPTETPTPTTEETATPSPTPEPNPTSDLLTAGIA